MMRPLLLGLCLAALALTGVATPVAADDVCAPLPDDHPASFCAEVEQCSALGFCVDPTDPYGTTKGLVTWVRDQMGPCTCDPEPTPI